MEPDQHQTPQSNTINYSTQASAQYPQAPVAQPQGIQTNKKRAYFWLIAPGVLFVSGWIITLINQAISAEGLHVIINLVAFLLIGFGFLAFVPGLIYGLSLLSKK